MIQFQVKKSNLLLFNGLLEVGGIPTYLQDTLDKFCGTLGGKKGHSQKDAEVKDKEYTIIIKENRKNRSLTANGTLWLALQHLANVYHTTKEELYFKYLREHGIFEYLAVIPETIPRIKLLFRIVDEIGTLKTEKGVELVRLRCYPGSSTYNTDEFGHFLEVVLEDCQKTGFSIISEKDKALLLDEWEKERR